MATYTAHLDFDQVFHSPDNCPECGSEDLTTVSDIDQTDFLCRRCGQRWHVGFGHMWEVDAPDAEQCQTWPRPRHPATSAPTHQS